MGNSNTCNILILCEKGVFFTETERKKVFLINVAFITVVLILVYLIARFMLSFLFPFVIGVILSYLVQKPAEKISEKTVFSKGICAAVFVTVTFIVAVSALAAILWAVFDMLTNFVTDTENMKNIEQILEKSQFALNKISENLPKGIANNSQRIFAELKNDILSRLASFVSSAATSIAGSIPSFLFGSVVTVVASCYIAKDYDRFLKFFKGLLSKKTVENAVIIKEILVRNVFNFVKGYLILLLITFGELSAGLLIIGVKSPFVLALIIALVDVLPVIGTGTVLIPWSVVCILSGNTAKGVSLLILYVIITVIRNFIEPKIIGERVGLNPLFMLIVIFVGLRLAGIVGMIILPIALIVVIDFYKRQMQQERK